VVVLYIGCLVILTL